MSEGPRGRLRRLAGTCCLLGIAVFACNALIGKYRVMTGSGTAAPLDGVPEFLLLAAAVALFVVYMLNAPAGGDGERAGDGAKRGPSPEGGDRPV